MKVVIVICLLMVAMAMLATAMLFDSVEEPKTLKEEDIQAATPVYRRTEYRPPKPINTVRNTESIETIIARATKRAEEYNKRNAAKKNSNDEDSRKSRMGGRDYPRSYER